MQERSLSWIPFQLVTVTKNKSQIKRGTQTQLLLQLQLLLLRLQTPMLPRFQFSIHLITWALLASMVMRVTMAWLYIKPADVVCRPTGDPVDSDPAIVSNSWADGLILKGLGYPCKTLTVFTRLACSGIHIILRNSLGVGCPLRTT